MIDFRFLKSNDATRLTAEVMGRAANPDRLLACELVRPSGGPTDTPAGQRTAKSDHARIRAMIAACEQEHLQLDRQLDKLTGAQLKDEMQIRRLKKHKLRLKDQIVTLQMQLVPDILA